MSTTFSLKCDTLKTYFEFWFTNFMTNQNESFSVFLSKNLIGPKVHKNEVWNSSPDLVNSLGGIQQLRGQDVAIF